MGMLRLQKKDRIQPKQIKKFVVKAEPPAEKPKAEPVKKSVASAAFDFLAKQLTWRRGVAAAIVVTFFGVLPHLQERNTKINYAYMAPPTIGAPKAGSVQAPPAIVKISQEEQRIAAQSFKGVPVFHVPFDEDPKKAWATLPEGSKFNPTGHLPKSDWICGTVSTPDGKTADVWMNIKHIDGSNPLSPKDIEDLPLSRHTVFKKEFKEALRQ